MVLSDLNIYKSWKISIGIKKRKFTKKIVLIQVNWRQRICAFCNASFVMFFVTTCIVLLTFLFESTCFIGFTFFEFTFIFWVVLLVTFKIFFFFALFICTLKVRKKSVRKKFKKVKFKLYFLTYRNLSRVSIFSDLFSCIMCFLSQWN